MTISVSRQAYYSGIRRERNTTRNISESDISGYHGGEYEGDNLLGYSAV
jgi:hypothetical protein